MKADYFDRFIDTDTLTNIRNTAKELHIPEKLFTYMLVEMGFAYRKNNRLLPEWCADFRCFSQSAHFA